MIQRVVSPLKLWIEQLFTGKTMSAKQIFQMLGPIFLDSSFIVIISILNTALISSSGVAAISAVSMVDSVNMFIVSIFIAVATGGTVIVAQYTGKRDSENANRAASQSITAVVSAALVITIFIIVFHQPILKGLFGQAEAEVFNNARLFLIGSALSFPFFALYQAVIGALRGVAETKACLFLSIILNISYFLLNVLLVSVFDLGVIGISIAYIVARGLGSIIALWYIVKKSQRLLVPIKEIIHFNWSLLKKIMFIGLPFAAEQLFFNGGKLLTQTFIVQLGTLSITVNAIANSISMLFQVGGSTLSIAIVTIVGQCIGRREIADARKFVKGFLLLSTVFFIVIEVILLLCFPFIIQIYNPPQEIISEIWILIVLISIAQPLFWSISFILPAALRAAGDSKFTSITALLSMWLFRVGFGYLLGITFGMGVFGVWLAMVVEWGIRGILFMLRYRTEHWYKHKLV